MLPDTIKPEDNKGDTDGSEDSLDDENVEPPFMTVREFAEFKSILFRYLIERIDKKLSHCRFSCYGKVEIKSSQI